MNYKDTLRFAILLFLTILHSVLYAFSTLVITMLPVFINYVLIGVMFTIISILFYIIYAKSLLGIYSNVYDKKNAGDVKILWFLSLIYSCILTFYFAVPGVLYLLTNILLYKKWTRK